MDLRQSAVNEVKEQTQLHPLCLRELTTEALEIYPLVFVEHPQLGAEDLGRVLDALFYSVADITVEDHPVFGIAFLLAEGGAKEPP